MATESDNVTEDEMLRHGLLRHTLASWRFILLFSLAPMVWVLFAAQPGILRAIIALLCAIVWFGCWRLWLDERYFSLITAHNNVQAGDALCFIWRRERLKTLTLAARQSGALQQCRYTLRLVIVLWAVWLVLLV
ncbi:hypothetical protein H4O05_11455 [Citrobacter freundii]|uniref:hypothetical protein n=1 Tax=Citrobacter freundii TaxID=546 RepID=UPI001625A8BD|nr:hypothetical protein [Citrobacter freundii]MBE8732450.1 hypothetical protein [Citrobacter freundii]MBJ8730475.1 hypothetical protein [Citrobacter freundii]UNM05270.1 hypothetical protein H4O05_11455 [Citrobacter freundii]HAT4393165.1 hypothetical protein [Citrobacter freundii]HCD1156367.1 hypothetical protein [Citrobacter freundii]